MTLAYVFWHWRRADAVAARYENLLASFHRSLATAAPAGFQGSTAFRISAVPWVDADEAYEDWYLVESFGALGVLNDAAVSAETGVEHDRVAELSEGGAGGLYGLRAGVASLEATNATWLSKPRDAGYAPFLDRLRQLLSPRDALWQRRLVLGPAPEFCIGSKEPVLTKGLSALAVERSLIYAAP